MSIIKAVVAAWSSRKLWAFLIVVGVSVAIFERTVNHLYSMPDDAHVAGLIQLALGLFGILGVAAGAYLGTSAITARFGLTGAAELLRSSVSEDKRYKEELNNGD